MSAGIRIRERAIIMDGDLTGKFFRESSAEK
jgi:hypothetical protein